MFFSWMLFCICGGNIRNMENGKQILYFDKMNKMSFFFVI